MPVTPDDRVLAQLIEAAYRQTLARFEKEVADGRRDPAAELAEYRRQRRDYASLLRIHRVPEEAKVLAQQLLQSHKLELEAAAREGFERDVAALLIRLYDDFIAAAQGNR